MKTPFIYFGLLVSLFGNMDLMYANTYTKDTNRLPKTSLTFENGVRLSKPSINDALDVSVLDIIVTPITISTDTLIEEIVEEGYKITDSKPQVYQMLSLQPTIMDTIIFNEAVIESNSIKISSNTID